MSAITTTATPYCSPADLLDYVDARTVGDCLQDKTDEPRPSRAAILDPTSPAGIRLNTLLLAASGELEEACVGGAGYSPADLASLTGATQASLKRVVAGLAVLALYARRQPTAEIPPIVQYAQERLEKLGKGERVFGLVPATEAAVGFEPITQVETVDPRIDRRTVTNAQRYFGNRAYP